MDEQTNETMNLSKTNEIEAKKAEVIERIGTMALASDATEIHVDLSKATRLPIGELASLGTAFASLPDAFRTITQTVSLAGEGLYHVRDQFGNALTPDVLFKFGDGSGLLGSFSDAVGLHQARLTPAGLSPTAVTTTVPYDPTLLFIAAALMEINKKLDDIKETQQEMFDFIKNKEKAKLRADLQTLTDILNDYRFNWGDKDYMQNKRNLVQFIKKDANQAIIHHRAEIKGKLGKTDFFHFDKDVKDKAQAVRSELEEYRLSVYLYAFSSFLEVMLYNNFSKSYLRGVIEKIEDHSNNYRVLYTQSYDLIELDADSSVRAMLFGGLSEAMGFLGKAIEKTPVGDYTPIDEALGEASKNLGELSEGMKQDMMKKLIDASHSDVRPFVESIKSVDRLYNEPVMLMADQEILYVLPADATNVEELDDESDE